MGLSSQTGSGSWRTTTLLLLLRAPTKRLAVGGPTVPAVSAAVDVAQSDFRAHPQGEQQGDDEEGDLVPAFLVPLPTRPSLPTFALIPRLAHVSYPQATRDNRRGGAFRWAETPTRRRGAPCNRRRPRQLVGSIPCNRLNVARRNRRPSNTKRLLDTR